MLLARHNPTSLSSVSRRGFLHADVEGTGSFGAATFVAASAGPALPPQPTVGLTVVLVVAGVVVG